MLLTWAFLQNPRIKMCMYERKGARQGARLGNNGPHADIRSVLGVQGLLGFKIALGPVVSGWKGNSHAARAMRKGGGRSRARGLSSETPTWPCARFPLLAPGEARRAALAKAPAARQPEGSPPPRGGRRGCRLRGSSAPAPPGRRLGQVRRWLGQPPTPGAEGDPSGVLRHRPRKRPCRTSRGRGLLGQT